MRFFSRIAAPVWSRMLSTSATVVAGPSLPRGDAMPARSSSPLTWRLMFHVSRLASTACSMMATRCSRVDLDGKRGTGKAAICVLPPYTITVLGEVERAEPRFYR